MSRFLYRHLRLLSVLAVIPWLVILVASAVSLATSTLNFDDVAYYSASIMLGVAILLTTLVLMGVQVRATDKTGEPTRGAALLGFVAAALAVAFVFFVPGWAGLFVWALAATVIHTRTTDLTSPAMRIVVLTGLGLFALSIPIAAFLSLTAEMLGTTLWLSLLLLSAVLVAWLAELAVRTARSAGLASTALPPTSA